MSFICGEEGPWYQTSQVTWAKGLKEWGNSKTLRRANSRWKNSPKRPLRRLKANWIPSVAGRRTWKSCFAQQVAFREDEWTIGCWLNRWEWQCYLRFCIFLHFIWARTSIMSSPLSGIDNLLLLRLLLFRYLYFLLRFLTIVNDSRLEIFNI